MYELFKKFSEDIILFDFNYIGVCYGLEYFVYYVKPFVDVLHDFIIFDNKKARKPCGWYCYSSLEAIVFNKNG